MTRIDESPWAASGWAAKGSQLQIQLYVNRRPAQLTPAVLDAFPNLAASTSTLEWKAPLENERFAEPQDLHFLIAIGCDHLADRVAAFWPAKGPVWDALAVGSGGEVVLVEAKSHPKEVYGGGTKASPASRERIEAAIRETQRALGLDENPHQWLEALRPGEPGHSSVYQSANRYAHLYWLRREGVRAWLVHVLFTDDPTWQPTRRKTWDDALPRIEADLGLRDVHVPHAGHVFLPGLDPRNVLVMA